MKAALACVKSELGADAMILSTRKISKKPLDPYSKEMIEVEAAVKTDTIAPSEPVTPVPEVQALQAELAEIKDMISLAGFGSGLPGVMNRQFESVGILASFLRAGVSERRAVAILERASAAIDPKLDKNERMRLLKKKVMQYCLGQIRVKDIFQEDTLAGAPHVAAFVGPTGVGKTTTIAKLAAYLSFTRKLRVGLISIDNYRIGAFEQLKSYASIMGLLCVPAFSDSDLSDALDRMGRMDVVLIDTAGHSHFDREKLREVGGLIQGDRAISVHLTLSVTSEFTNMKEAASAFSTLNPDSYVFTKIDEGRRCGKILDQIMDYHLPVSLMTNGQRVPEDLIVPDKQNLLKIILGKGSKGDA